MDNHRTKAVDCSLRNASYIPSDTDEDKIRYLSAA